MRKLMLVLFILMFPLWTMAGGFVLTWENDSFLESDDDYTHGMDILWIDNLSESNLVRSAWGLRHRMYTPKRIVISTPQPQDRQWCGVTTITRQYWIQEDKETVLYDIEVGVLGPSAQGEFFQTEVHKILDSKTPLGWDNQFPDEPAINLYMERHHPIVLWGERFQLGPEMIYGGTLGTTYVNGMGGIGAKTGWNIPDDHMSGLIGAKSIKKWNPFVYVFVDQRAYLVAHNATLGDSFFHKGRDGEQELEDVVVEFRYGVSLGVNGFAITGARVDRSNDFIGQADDTDYGMIRFEFVNQF